MSSNIVYNVYFYDIGFKNSPKNLDIQLIRRKINFRQMTGDAQKAQMTAVPSLLGLPDHGVRFSFSFVFSSSTNFVVN